MKILLSHYMDNNDLTLIMIKIKMEARLKTFSKN